MLVNEDDYINQVIHDPGADDQTVDQLETPFVVVDARTLVDPRDDDDLAQWRRCRIRSRAQPHRAGPSRCPSTTRTASTGREALLELARDLTVFDKTFGRRDEVHPVHHLIGTAAGWGGLPDAEAAYVGVDPKLPVGEYELTVGADVPVDRVLVHLGVQQGRVLRTQRS